MGRKRTWNWQHFLFYFICCPLIMAWMAGCGYLLKASQTRQPQPLLHAKVFLANGNYEAALRETKKILSSNSQTRGDEAFYLMGIIYVHTKNPSPNLGRALESFQSLIKKYPHSDLIEEAETWVATLRKIKEMNNEIMDLKNQIEQLKKIDLGIEEKKRRTLSH